MISEPEMAGEDGTFGVPAPPEVLDPGEPPPPVRERRPRGPWQRWAWALGGAVAASAVWGAALIVYQPGDRAPDMHGYRLVKDPCPGIGLKALGSAIAPRRAGSYLPADVLRHPALDRASCSIGLREKDAPANRGGIDHYSVSIEIDLHKRTDPREEFEARRNDSVLGFQSEAEVEIVPDLGEKAYLLSAPGGETELRVLDGGAVFSLRLTSYFVSSLGPGETRVTADDDDEPSTSAYQSAMISDMRDLMASLKR
ncbi:hypothetical protein [Streptomyces sp. NPDC057682]|uniref:hypothetical protein n=1 Tax=unclassified Streptomyces TaxID=2593676 RepID=UPI00366828FD